MNSYEINLMKFSMTFSSSSSLFNEDIFYRKLLKCIKYLEIIMI